MRLFGQRDMCGECCGFTDVERDVREHEVGAAVRVESAGFVSAESQDRERDPVTCVEIGFEVARAFGNDDAGEFDFRIEQLACGFTE